MEHKKSKKFRPTWDDYFMAMARVIATRATCDRLKVGAVLVNNHRIVSTGYNGAPPGLEHCDDVGHLLEDGHCVRTIHAEHNAILQAAVIGGTSTKGSTMYTLYSPCIHCAKYIATAGIVRVVVGKMYRYNEVVEYLRTAGVVCDTYQASLGWYAEISELFECDITEPQTSSVKLMKQTS